MAKKDHEKNPFLEYEDFTDISKIAEAHLGIPGRMLYHSKSRAKPTTIFNANIFDERAKKVWYGDLEIDRDREALLAVSRELGPLYVLWEMDGRFLDFVPTKKYVEARAEVTISERGIFYTPTFSERVYILTRRTKAPKEKNESDSAHVKTGSEAVGPKEDMMHYEIFHSAGSGRKERAYAAVTPSCAGGFAFGETPENALRALKRIFTIRKRKEKAERENKP